MKKYRRLAIIIASVSALGFARARANFIITGTTAHSAPLRVSVKNSKHSQTGLEILPYRNVWRIVMVPADQTLLGSISHDARGPTGAVIARHLVEALQQKGYRRVAVTVDKSASTIFLRVQPVFSTAGPFSGFLPAGKTVTPATIKSALPLLSAAAVAHHERINLHYQGPSMVAGVTPMAGRPWRVGTIFSSFGPRYAGSDVLSGYGYAHISGFDLSDSVTRGLPGMTMKQSRGGGYLGESIEIRRPTPEGIFGLSFSHAHYLVGGPLQPLSLSGDVTQVRLGNRYPLLDGRAWLRGGLVWSGETEHLGAFGWQTRQRDTSAYLGASGSYVYRQIGISWRATLIHGVAGSDEAGSGQPNLMGRWSSSYTVERGRIEADRKLDMVRLSTIFGFQHGSSGTPQVEQTYIGGEHRGSSFFTGSFSAPSGFWWSAQIAKSAPVHFAVEGIPVSLTPFLGLNGGAVMPDIGPTDDVAAFNIGASFKVGQHVNGMVGWSHTIAEPRGSAQHDMLNFEVVTGF